MELARSQLINPLKATSWIEALPCGSRASLLRAAASVLEGSRGSSQALAGGELFHEMEPADVRLAPTGCSNRGAKLGGDDFGARARSRK